jgi:hypothetical protein
MPHETYVFVDAGHLQRYYGEAMQKWTGTDGELDLERVKTLQGATKCFYYDCLNDIKGSLESDADFAKRVATQEERFQKIQRLKGTHVRLGSLTGTAKNKRQKQVDILLAVDMMNHAVRGNMAYAVLIAGDQDFKPLVEALVDMGLHVHILGDRRHTSRDLADAADFYQPLTLADYWNWSSRRVHLAYPIPNKTPGNPYEIPKEMMRKVGTIDGKPATLFFNGSDYIVTFPLDDAFMFTSFKDEDRLLQFCEVEFGPVVWPPR